MTSSFSKSSVFVTDYCRYRQSYVFKFIRPTMGGPSQCHEVGLEGRGDIA